MAPSLEADPSAERHRERHDEGEEDRHRGPRGSGREGDQRRCHEDEGGQERRHQGVAEDLRQIGRRPQGGRDLSQGPRQGEDDGREDQGSHPAEPGVDRLLEGEDALPHREADRDEAPGERAPEEGLEGIGRPEHVPQGTGAGRRPAVEVEAENNDEDHGQHRNGRVVPASGHPLLGLRRLIGRVHQELRAIPVQPLSPPRPALRREHRAEVPLSCHEQADHGDRQDRVEEVRDGVKEDREGAGAREIRGHLGRDARLLRGDRQGVPDQGDLVADPGGDEDDGRDRCGRGVDDVRQLLPRDPHAVRDRPEGVPDQQGVGVVVEEDRQAGQPGGELGPPRVGG